MPTIRFMKDKKLVKEVYVAAGTNLRQAALSNDINPHHGMVPVETAIVQFVKGCKGFGLCATCSVNVNSEPRTCHRWAPGKRCGCKGRLSTSEPKTNADSHAKPQLTVIAKSN